MKHFYKTFCMKWCSKNVDINFSVHDTFLEKLSSGTLKIERLKNQLIYSFWSNKTKVPKQNRQNRHELNIKKRIKSRRNLELTCRNTRTNIAIFNFFDVFSTDVWIGNCKFYSISSSTANITLFRTFCPFTPFCIFTSCK